MNPATNLPPCDLVMKGGITSGVVYPKLITELSRSYRFKSVGGTSAGAIAAAGCAAAELGRQSGRNPQAFEHLAQLPDTLGAPAMVGRDGSMLFHLFKPAPWLTDHFAVLLGMLNRAGAAGMVFGALAALLRRFWIVAGLVVLVMALLGVPALMAFTGSGWLGAARLLGLCLLATAALWVVVGIMPGGAGWRIGLALLLGAGACAWLLRAQGGLTGTSALVLATAAVVLWTVLTAAVAAALALARFVISLLSGLQRNGWGLCSGHSTDEAMRPQALTDWLTGYFDSLAGLNTHERPLTFGDLWGRPDSGPSAKPEDGDLAPPRDINLQVMTTAVSQHLCYALPLRDKVGEFWYQRDEWASLFPARVMRWLDAVSAVLDGPQPQVGPQGRPLRRLPHNADLPVVVAVRMSLSFPLLLSAVPLYARDWSLATAEVPEPVPTKVWFSDGGISSNMPLHFFDGPLPRHPTFAVNLTGEHPRKPIDPELKASEQTGRVFLPTDNRGGRVLHWQAPDDRKPGAGLFAFLADIVETMQNWRDQIQFPYPGYRDRIVQISQRPDEGGLNLNMPRKHIERLADAGEFAAQVLVRRFAVGAGWANHREIRVRSFLALVQELVSSRGVQDVGWDAVIQQLDGDELNQAQKDLALHTLAQMRALGQDFANSTLSLIDKAPKPRPQLRISPRI